MVAYARQTRQSLMGLAASLIVALPLGARKVAGWPGWVGCHEGDSIGYVFRVWDTNTGAWGPGSFATPVTCP
ncbi:hypothetical protein EDD30_6794 [Couchioplanes caeruleus]|uniref:Uncharacterized protein n=1 Tax=Couchioplanes caeruleus TaxID=56438 RepID=A0A3N1GUG1_9ACTN|nr:hypothetical protein EDD30_6794 [Couchioplanes caeruleus]